MTTNTTTTEMTFEELLQEAARISDARTKIFGELVKRIEDKCIPALSQVMKMYEIEKISFSCETQPISISAKYMNYETNEDEFSFSVTQDLIFSDAHYDLGLEKFIDDGADFKLEEISFPKKGAIELANKIKNKIKNLNSLYENVNIKANGIIEKS